MMKLLNNFKAPSHQVQEVRAQLTAEAWDLSQVAELPQAPTEEAEWLVEDQATNAANTSNKAECPQTKNTEQRSAKQQTNKDHQVAQKAQQKQSDPKGQTNQVKRPTKASSAAATGNTEILSIHINDIQTSTYNANIGNTSIKALFDSGATLSCISQCCYDRICNKEPDWIIDANVGPPIIITSALSEELTNLGRCRLCFKLGDDMFKYSFQIIKNLKRDLILGLNFQKMFKISKDVTDTEDLYLYIRNKIVTFSIQSTNTSNYICTQECLKIEPKNWKQFRVKAPKGLKNWEIYEVDFNTNGLPKGVVPLECTFIAGAY